MHAPIFLPAERERQSQLLVGLIVCFRPTLDRYVDEWMVLTININNGIPVGIKIIIHFNLSDIMSMAINVQVILKRLVVLT